jgi:hypothetical protein
MTTTELTMEAAALRRSGEIGIEKPSDEAGVQRLAKFKKQKSYPENSRYAVAGHAGTVVERLAAAASVLLCGAPPKMER